MATPNMFRVRGQFIASGATNGRALGTPYVYRGKPKTPKPTPSDVACPRCGSPAGAVCMRATGGPLGNYHAARRDAVR